MKKTFLLLILFSSLTMADSVLLVKKGWQLIGSSSDITEMSKFESHNVEELWHFDAELQQWRAYSPDPMIQEKMNKKGILPIESLKNWHGFWVKSKREWTLILSENEGSMLLTSEDCFQDTIQLKEGWNLVSLPIDTVVAADVFNQMTVWKYSQNDEWQLFDDSETQTGFERLGHIKNSDGIWVKAPQDTNISLVEQSSKLHNFKTVAEMESYIKEMVTLNNRPYWGIEPLVLQSNEMVNTDALEMDEPSVAIPSQENTAKDATQTNLQEQGVDESDIVKHNGVDIFYTSRNHATQNSIQITTFERLVSGLTEPRDTISFDDKRLIDSLYLSEGRLVVLSSLYQEDKEVLALTSKRETSLPSFGLGTAQVMVDVFDVSDIDKIQNIAHYKIDGSMLSSRVVAGKLYLISRFEPNVQIEYPKIEVALSEQCQAYFTEVLTATRQSDFAKEYAECYHLLSDDGKHYYRYDYENPKINIKALTPTIEDHKSTRMALIQPERLYAAAKKNQSSSITSISEIALIDGAYKQSNSFIGESQVQYASSNAFYLVSTMYPQYYDFRNYKDCSTLYKFAFDDALKYQGIGTVYGKPLNQFSLSEHKGIIRIATTEGFSWSRTGTQNNVYTLKQEEDALKVQGLLSGLGKEGERIYAVRFMGDKAYVVTFEQIDPLYTLDLSNPKIPQKVGELQINGYSSYLHIVDETKLLGIGRDATPEGEVLGLKLELFDVSDFANPTSIDTISYPKNTYSELEHNHKALAYRNSNKLFAFPYQDYQSYPAKIYLGVYQIKGEKLHSYAPIVSQSTKSWWGEHRGILFDYNGTSYVSFFSGDQVQTEKVNLND